MSESFEEIHARRRQLEAELRMEEQARVAAFEESRRDGPGVTPGVVFGGDHRPFYEGQPHPDEVDPLPEDLCDFVPTPEMRGEVNPKQLAATRDQKPPLHLLEYAADIEIAEVLGHGAHKYGRKNFKVTPILANVYIGAIRRHIGQWATGEDLDPESGLSHLAHIGANIHVLFAAMAAGTFVDDRAPEEQSEVQKRLSDLSNAPRP